jgi:uncharacterized protein YceK
MKNKLIILFSICIFLSGCSASRNLKMVKDNVQADYLKEKYLYKKDSMGSIITITSMNERNLEYFKDTARRALLESTNLSEAEQSKSVKELESFQYEQDRYFCFEINMPEPILQEDQQLKFIVKDISNFNYVEDVFRLYQSYYGFGYGSKGYIYSWVIKTSSPMANKNIGLEKRPIDLIIIFPNGSEQHYRILDK